MPEQILEPDGTLWKPEPWATASAEEFSAARALIISMNEERRWNPWVVEDCATTWLLPTRFSTSGRERSLTSQMCVLPRVHGRNGLRLHLRA